MGYEPFAISWPDGPPNRLPLEFRGLQAGDLAFAPDEHLVALFDNQGSLGSGALVGLPNATSAILTARHIVIDLLVAGAFHCLVPSAGWTTLEPVSLRLHPRRDAALVQIGKGLETALPWDAWKPTSAPALAGNVLAVGLPGEWKGSVDTGGRRIAHLRGLATSCVADPLASIAGRQALDLPAAMDLPTRFGGMSGGPVYSDAGRLVGVLTHETVREPRRLIATPISELDALVTPYAPPPDAPSDFLRQVATAVVPIRYRNRNWYPHGPFHVVGLFEHFWSQSSPDIRISRLVALGSASAPHSSRFVLNTESIFHPRGGDIDEQIRECRLELDQLLATPSMEILEKGPEPSDATLELADSMIDQIAPNQPRTVLRSSDTE